MRIRLSAAVLSAAFVAIYLPDLGHGFIKDDFAWIRTSASDSVGAFVELFRTNVGFYRPLVSASFAADFAVWNLNPFGYGITNLLLCVANALFLFALTRRLAFPPPAALMATAVWAFNFHGINMALLWLSGRTALLVSVFALATAHAFIRAHHLTAGLLCAAALFSKEEAVMLPAILTGFVLLTHPAEEWRGRLRVIASRTWPLWLA